MAAARRRSRSCCTPAQLVVALMTRWLLVVEEADAATLRLGRGIARAWFADGATVAVDDAPTRRGSD